MTLLIQKKENPLINLARVCDIKIKGNLRRTRGEKEHPFEFNSNEEGNEEKSISFKDILLIWLSRNACKFQQFDVFIFFLFFAIRL